MEYSVPKRNDLRLMISDARVRRSRAELRTALLHLLETKPFDAITIREIAAAAQVGYTTYFRHYPGKDALLDDLAADEISRLTAFTLPIYDSADPGPACLALCRYIDQHRALWSKLLAGGAAAIVKEELLRQGCEAASARGEKQLLPPELGIALAVAVIVELLSWWLRQPDPWPADEVAKILDRTAIAPLLQQSWQK